MTETAATSDNVGAESYIGKIMADERTNSVIIMATEQAIEDVKEFIARIDYDFANMRFTSITGYVESDFFLQGDIDGGSGDDHPAAGDQRQHGDHRDRHQDQRPVEPRPVEAVGDVHDPLHDEHGDEAEHFHYDVRFAIQTFNSAGYQVSDESHDLAWIEIQKLHTLTQDESMLRMARKWEQRGIPDNL